MVAKDKHTSLLWAMMDNKRKKLTLGLYLKKLTYIDKRSSFFGLIISDDEKKVL
jgi:hypothetical protein